MPRKSGIAAVLLGLVCSSWAVAQEVAGNPKNGEAIYMEHCQRCHGAKLEGNGPDAQYLVVPPADLRSMESRLKSDFELLVAIAHGVLFSPMHGWRDRLSEQEILDVLAYIRMMAPPRTIS